MTQSEAGPQDMQFVGGFISVKPIMEFSTPSDLNNSINYSLTGMAIVNIAPSLELSTSMQAPMFQNFL